MNLLNSLLTSITSPSSPPYSSIETKVKNTIWAKAIVIMMKFTPRVRRQTKPVASANTADTAIATRI